MGAQRIGSRWPWLRLPAPRVPATELVASGRTAAGTEYELRFGARDARFRRSGWSVELIERRLGEAQFEPSAGLRGPGRPPSELELSMTGSCDSREAFVLGWAPPRVAAVALVTRDHGRIEPSLLGVDGQESRLVFMQLDDVPLVKALEVAGRDGTSDRDDVAQPHEPCRDGEGAFIVNWWNAPA